MKIIWSPTSRRKIEQIIDYISADNIDAALALVEEFERRVADLKKHPRFGRMVPILNDEMVRELIIRKDYLIVYEIQREHITVLTIRHAKQDFDESDLDLK
jgi:addiction module RelE/StbE family toxin